MSAEFHEPPPSPAVDPASRPRRPPLTEKQAVSLAKKYIGSDAIISSTRTVMPDGEIVLWFIVGHTGDDISWTESGRGRSWREAIRVAASGQARRRRAYRGLAKGGL